MTSPEPVCTDRSSLERVTTALGGRITSSHGDQVDARCPAHDDGNASLSVTWRVDSTGSGRTLVNCHTGCDVRDVIEALSLTMSDLHDRPPARPADARSTWNPPRRPRRAPTKAATATPPKPRGPMREVATYTYCDADGVPIYEIVRKEPIRRPTTGKTKKTFSARVIDSQGRRQPKGPAVPRRVLYRLPTVLAAARAGVPVYVVEGEKDADALTEVGCVATCNPFGAAANGKQKSHWLPQYTEALTGAHVVIITDLDAPTEAFPIPAGFQHAAHVAAQLDGHAASVTVLAPRAGKDAFDHLAAGHSPDEFQPIDVNAELAAAHAAEDRVDDPTDTDPERAGSATAASGPSLDHPDIVDRTVEASPAADAPESTAGADDRAPAGTVDLGHERRRRRGTDDEPPPPRRVFKIHDRYAIVDGELCQLKLKRISHKDGSTDSYDEARVLLPVAPIVQRRLRKDLGELREGQEPRVTHYDLTVRGPDGEVIDLPAVADEDWRDLSWTTNLPWPCPIEDTSAGRSRIRAAITAVSGITPVETLHGLFGWRKIANRWVYLHAGGGIDAGGVVADVRVETSPKYEDFHLPAPAGDVAELRASLEASLALMDVVPERLAAPMLGAAYRACLGWCNVTIMPVAPPTSGKTGLAAFGQQHFAPNARHEHMPFGAGDEQATLTSLEEHRHVIGDMLTIVDDGAPDRGTEALGRRLNALARSQFAQRGKDRGKRDGGIRPEHKPRGLLGITAEQWTGIESAESRVVALEMRRGELDGHAVFGPLDADGGPERRATLIATMAMHYANQMPMTSWLRDTRATLTDAMINPESTDPGNESRRCAGVADLAVGWRALLDMAVTRGALTEDEASTWWTRAWTALIECKDRMMASSATRRPSEVAAEALRAGLHRGSASLLDRQTGGQPKMPEVCGWERLNAASLSGDIIWRRAGAPVGWTDGVHVWLEPSAATDEINRRSTAVGQSLNLTQAGLAQMLADSGVIRTRETKEGSRKTVKVRVGPSKPGPQVTVWEASWSWLFPEEDDTDPELDDPTPHLPTTPPPPPQIPALSAPATAPTDAVSTIPTDSEPAEAEQDHTLPLTEPEPAPPSAEPATEEGLETVHEPATPPTQPARQEPAGAAVQAALRAGYSGVALVAAAAVGWLAHPGEPATFVELGTDTLDGILQLAEQLNLGHRDGRGAYRGARHAAGQLWLLPAARAKVGLPSTLPDRPDTTEPASHRRIREQIETAGWTVSNSTLGGWNKIYRPGGRSLYLVIPEWQNDASPLGDHHTIGAQELATRLGMYAHATGVSYSFSPGVSAISLVAATRPALATAERPQLPDVAELPTRERDYVWARPVAPDEREMRWVDLWDCNAAYLGAATSLPLGIGAPIHHDAPTFDPKIPGYWRIASPSPWEHARLPDPLAVASRDKADHLVVTTPTMKILTELYEIDPTIVEGWLWTPTTAADGTTTPNSVRVLDKWAAELGRARLSLLEPANETEEAVLGAVKETYRAGVGRLDRTLFRERLQRYRNLVSRGKPVERKDLPYPLHRPDWRHHVIAQCRYALTRKMIAAAEHERYPLALIVDAVVYPSNDDKPTPPPGWTEGPKLGQVHHLGRAPMDLIAPMLEGVTMPPPTVYAKDNTITKLGLVDTIKAAGKAAEVSDAAG